MNRRRLLALLGSATALAGCPTRDDSPATGSTTDGDTSRQTNSPPPDTVTSPSDSAQESLDVGDGFRTATGETLRVSDVRLARSVFDLVYPDAVSPLAPTDSQFVFLTVGLDDPNALVPTPQSFQLRVDEEAITGRSRVADRHIDRRLAIPNEFINLTPDLAAEQGENRATVGFEVPFDVDPDRVFVEWQGDDETARWDWDDGLVDDLATPPAFDVTEIDHPDSFVCGERFETSVTITNAGGRAEAFRAIFPAKEPIATGQTVGISESVPADGTATWNGFLEFPPPLAGESCDDGVESATFELDWGVDTREITVSRDG